MECKCLLDKPLRYMRVPCFVHPPGLIYFSFFKARLLKINREDDMPNTEIYASNVINSSPSLKSGEEGDVHTKRQEVASSSFSRPHLFFYPNATKARSPTKHQRGGVILVLYFVYQYQTIELMLSNISLRRDASFYRHSPFFFSTPALLLLWRYLDFQKSGLGQRTEDFTSVVWR